MKNTMTLLFLLCGTLIYGQQKLINNANALAEKVEAKTIEWRHDIHQNPELSNREFKTAEKIAEHLKSLGIEVKTGVAHTGVVGILKGGKPGPVVGLRADIDALPVTERVDIPYKSIVKSTYNGVETGVMHACGHDTHVAMLMGVAEVLSKMKKDLSGTVKFIFQPAEEGAPPSEEGGAKMMVKEGVLKSPDVDVVFGMHISSDTPVGEIEYKSGGMMAAADRFVIKVKGKQSHGSAPWNSVDPIVTSAQIINGLQTIVSRSSELTKEAAVITVGMIKGGVRNNIIPEEVEMIGTIRTLDIAMQDIIHERLRTVATKIAESMGAVAEVTLNKGTPVTYNNPQLTSKVAPWLTEVTGEGKTKIIKAVTGAEDFAYYANEVPSFFYFVGGCPLGEDPKKAAPHHTPDFRVDDAGMLTGMKAMLNLTIKYMNDPLK
ncbi:MAG: amidohydrolase [Cyclobacteriaceae bacterium]|nr:amidohydrolase [Cyclobacteriaceae bacterium]